MIDGHRTRTERRARLARRFKLAIAAATTLVIVLMLAGTSSGRYLSAWLATRSKWAALQAVGLPVDRAEVDADWRRRRLRDVDQTRTKLRSIYSEYDASMRVLLDYAGLDPDHALLRWGNFDRTLYLPSTVFEADDAGRSYRFRPHVRSIWVRNLKLKGGILAYFPVPIGPELPGLAAKTGAVIVESSVQTTNSWGLRGPEPAVDAPTRGILLGDSYMQGLFVGDDETPAACLERELSRRLGERVAILNTGHLGYSTEQEYFTLKEYVDRFRPQFVVLGVFANDFGDLFEVLDGKADWDEGAYWLGRIAQLCRTKELVLLTVASPWVNQVDGVRRPGSYPGMISNILESPSQGYLDPTDDFIDASLGRVAESRRAGAAGGPSPLFNSHLADGHFSPQGCEVWARSVATRLELLLRSVRPVR